jgi:NADH-quinone oxidoreductase subunit E
MLAETHAQEIEALISRFADRRSAVLPVLYIAQDTYGTLTPEAIREVAEALDLPYTDVFEVVGFYTLFYDHPIGTWVVQVCDDVPCCYLGAEDVIAALKERLGVREEQVTEDGMFMVQRVKCLAACDRPPVVQANLCYFYDVTAERVDEFLAFLRQRTDSEIASSVSGHHAEDFEPGPDGGFRKITYDLGAMPEASAAPTTTVETVDTTDTTAAAAESPAAAAERAEEESPVESSPDQTSAAAHPAPDKQDDTAVPPYPAQQKSAEAESKPDKTDT